MLNMYNPCFILIMVGSRSKGTFDLMPTKPYLAKFVGIRRNLKNMVTWWDNSTRNINTSINLKGVIDNMHPKRSRVGNGDIQVFHSTGTRVLG